MFLVPPILVFRCLCTEFRCFVRSVRAGGCPVVVAQWQSTGGSSQVSWVQFPVTTALFTFPLSPQLSLFQCEARVLSRHIT